MAVRTSNFEIAAADAEKAPVDVAQENVAELQHGGGRFSLWRRPTPGQYAMFQLRVSRTQGTEQARGIDRFLTALVLTPEEAVADGRTDEDGVTYEERVKDGEVAVGLDFFWDLVERDLLDESVLIDMLKEAIELHAGFPTSSEPASSGGRKGSGPPSTAASRRAGSTRSRSNSAAS